MKIGSVTMVPSGRQFEVLPGQTLLEAGLAAGIALPFGCANGSCGTCQARVQTGSVDKIKHHDFVLTETQKLDGHCLLCSCSTNQNINIEVLEANSVVDIPHQELQAKLCRSERSQNVIVLAFKFVRGKALRFLPGQRVQLTQSAGSSIELAIASCPCNAQYVEFHIANNEHSQLEAAQWAELMLEARSRERISVSGPLGDFTLSNNIGKPKLFIANGIEFAQLQGMIEQVLNSELDVPCFLIWQASANTPHYRLNWCQSWRDAFDNFDFLAIETNAAICSVLPASWLSKNPGYEVYIGAMHHELHQNLINLGIPPDSIFFPAS